VQEESNTEVDDDKELLADEFASMMIEANKMATQELEQAHE
jgi:hypothetical protein